jgi:DMSO/TMAO reductase YedYZ molybdopterin-dependent catalytic subunit
MNNTEQIVDEKFVKRKTITAIFFFVLFIASCLFAWNSLQKQPKVDGALQPLRKGLIANEWLFSNILFSSNHLSATYSKNQAAPKVRVNGDAGLKNNADTANWKLEVVRQIGDTLRISLADIKALPKREIIFDFKCIEGWNQITHWGGVRFSDFVNKYGLFTQSNMKYVGLETPDGEYYVGIDMASMMHPQTILCYEMNGKPLPMNQGFPLRLIIPVKYGVKHLKRIGTLFFDNEKPRDYWYERGYDYYCGM